jgi:anti-anti-sigma factor
LLLLGQGKMVSWRLVVALHGEPDIADAASIMAVLTAAAARNARIIVDLAALEYIDCCALAAYPAPDLT